MNWSHDTNLRSALTSSSTWKRCSDDDKGQTDFEATFRSSPQLSERYQYLKNCAQVSESERSWLDYTVKGSKTRSPRIQTFQFLYLLYVCVLFYYLLWIECGRIKSLTHSQLQTDSWGYIIHWRTRAILIDIIPSHYAMMLIISRNRFLSTEQKLFIHLAE